MLNSIFRYAGKPYHHRQKTDLHSSANTFQQLKKKWADLSPQSKEEGKCKTKSHIHQSPLPESLVLQPVHPGEDNRHVWSCLPQLVKLPTEGADLSATQPHTGQGKGRGVFRGVAGREGQVEGQRAEVTHMKWPCPALTCGKNVNWKLRMIPEAGLQLLEWWWTLQILNDVK